MIKLNERLIDATTTVIAVAPTCIASFVYSCMQTMLMGQDNGKLPVYV